MSMSEATKTTLSEEEIALRKIKARQERLRLALLDAQARQLRYLEKIEPIIRKIRTDSVLGKNNEHDGIDEDDPF